jgi:hypothetical protein
MFYTITSWLALLPQRWEKIARAGILYPYICKTLHCMLKAPVMRPDGGLLYPGSSLVHKKQGQIGVISCERDSYPFHVAVEGVLQQGDEHQAPGNQDTHYIYPQQGCVLAPSPRKAHHVDGGLTAAGCGQLKHHAHSNAPAQPHH